VDQVKSISSDQVESSETSEILGLRGVYGSSTAYLTGCGSWFSVYRVRLKSSEVLKVYNNQHKLTRSC
jgi:hypothetical protein